MGRISPARLWRSEEAIAGCGEGIGDPALRTTSRQAAPRDRRGIKIGLEGVVAKRKDSRYESGERSGAWVKLKLDKQQEFVIGGFRPGSNGVDALLVGYHEGKELRFAGKVRPVPLLTCDVKCSTR
jgi:bifunctional non-homologous end joining protein LigD